MSDLKRILVGNTFKQTFVSSASIPTAITASIINGEEVVVDSGSGVSSGNGHYYRYAMVSTPGYYVSQWAATINGNEFKKRQRFKAVLNEVD